MYVTLLSLLILIIFSSCGPSKGTPRKLEVSFGSLSSTRPTMLYGQKSDLSAKFGVKLTSNSITLPLENGEWKFQAINWETTTMYTEGNPHCGHTSITLSDTVSTVSINMSKTNCTDAEWMGSYQNYLSPPNDPFFLAFTLSICPPGGASNTFSPCSFSNHGVTGLKFIFPAYKDESFDIATGLQTACYPTNNQENLSLAPNIPMGTLTDFPMSSMIKMFYAPPGCTGASCCAGFIQDYIFPHGFGAAPVSGVATSPHASTSRMLKLERKTDPYIEFAITTPVSYSSGTCEPIDVKLKNADSTDYTTVNAQSVSLTCSNCYLYTTNSCSTQISNSVSIPANTSSTTVYFKPLGAIPKIFAASSGRMPANLTVPLSVTYADIDAAFLSSVTSLSEISNTSATPTNLVGSGNFFIFETRNGNRGKLKINSSSGANQFNFDVVNFDASTSFSGQNITACFTGSCQLDLESSTSPLTSTGPSDFWFEDLSSTIYFNPQFPAVMYKMP